jgi:hypothetical protein
MSRLKINSQPKIIFDGNRRPRSDKESSINEQPIGGWRWTGSNPNSSGGKRPSSLRVSTILSAHQALLVLVSEASE